MARKRYTVESSISDNYLNSFVCAHGDEGLSSSGFSIQREGADCLLSGTDARSFYEKLTEDIPSYAEKSLVAAGNANAKCADVEAQTKKIFVTVGASDKIVRRCCKDILQFSSDGNLSKLQTLLDEIRQYKEKFSILNHKDSYGWTAVMCAAGGGHQLAVSMLIAAGCDVNTVTSSGMSPLDVARACGQVHVLDILKNGHKVGSPVLDMHRVANTAEPENCIKCEVCYELFDPKLRQVHESSIPHLFKERKTQVQPSYLPVSNLGYQMLLRSGWQHGCGLGPNGDGIKAPVSGLQKRDRCGLGLKQKRRRLAVSSCQTLKMITHKECMTSDINGRRSRSKQFEMDFRKQFK